jgi:hypothetical protein
MTLCLSAGTGGAPSFPPACGVVDETEDTVVPHLDTMAKAERRSERRRRRVIQNGEDGKMFGRVQADRRTEWQRPDSCSDEENPDHLFIDTLLYSNTTPDVNQDHHHLVRFPVGGLVLIFDGLHVSFESGNVGFESVDVGQILIDVLSGGENSDEHLGVGLGEHDKESSI